MDHFYQVDVSRAVRQVITINVMANDSNEAITLALQEAKFLDDSAWVKLGHRAYIVDYQIEGSSLAFTK
jgi:predicted TIM-barrel enzyme